MPLAEQLRREVLAEMRGASAPPAVASRLVPLADVAAPDALMVAASALTVPQDVLTLRGRAVQQVACPPLAQHVVGHAERFLEAKPSLGEAEDALVRSIWDVESPSWAVTSYAQRAKESGLRPIVIQRYERRLAAAADLHERHSALQLQAETLKYMLRVFHTRSPADLLTDSRVAPPAHPPPSQSHPADLRALS